MANDKEDEANSQNHFRDIPTRNASETRASLVFPDIFIFALIEG